MAGLGREQEYHHRSDLLRGGHAMFERNLGEYVLQFLLGTRKRVEPVTVERRHHLGGNDGVHANAIRE